MKICPVCGKILHGRSDKIYCTPKCKNADHYEKRIINEKFYLLVDKQLKTNRRILKEFNKAGKAIVRKTVLFDEGFDPKYFTHTWTNRSGDVYSFCYEYGFLSSVEHGKAKYILITWQGYMNWFYFPTASPRESHAQLNLNDKWLIWEFYF